MSSQSPVSASPNTHAIDTLLRLVPDRPDTVLTHLSRNPHLSTASDASGYSLLHAAASYNQLTLLRTLVHTYNADVNIADEEGETPLFAAETLAAAKCLVEELGADTGWRNLDGSLAEDVALSNVGYEDDGSEWADVTKYLETWRTGGGAIAGGGSAAVAVTGLNGHGEGEEEESRRPPALPPGVQINMRTMEEIPEDGQSAPDPEFKRRIDDLAARNDFQGDEAQAELRKLVTDAIGGLAAAQNSREVRPREE